MAGLEGMAAGWLFVERVPGWLAGWIDGWRVPVPQARRMSTFNLLRTHVRPLVAQQHDPPPTCEQEDHAAEAYDIAVSGCRLVHCWEDGGGSAARRRRSH